MKEIKNFKDLVNLKLMKRGINPTPPLTFLSNNLLNIVIIVLLLLLLFRNTDVQFSDESTEFLTQKDSLIFEKLDSLNEELRLSYQARTTEVAALEQTYTGEISELKQELKKSNIKLENLISRVRLDIKSKHRGEDLDISDKLKGLLDSSLKQRDSILYLRLKKAIGDSLSFDYILETIGTLSLADTTSHKNMKIFADVNFSKNSFKTSYEYDLILDQIAYHKKKDFAKPTTYIFLKSSDPNVKIKTNTIFVQQPSPFMVLGLGIGQVSYMLIN